MSARETSTSLRHTGNVSALWLLFGPTVWAAHFTILYLAHTLLCAVTGPAAGRIVTIVVIIATLAALVALVIPFVRALPPARQPHSDAVAVSRFIRNATAWLLVLSAVAVIWAGVTSLIVTACGAPQ